MTLLAEIEAFLTEKGMPASTFGKLAVGDPRFVSDLRKGRQPRTGVRTRCRTLMAHRADMSRQVRQRSAFSLGLLDRDEPRMTVLDEHRTTLPDRPCFRCEARGLCRHRPTLSAT